MTNQHPRFQVSRASKGREKVSVWWKCLYSASARSLRRRSVLVTERARLRHAKWSAYYGVDLRSKYKPDFRYRFFFNLPISSCCLRRTARRFGAPPSHGTRYGVARLVTWFATSHHVHSCLLGSHGKLHRKRRP